MLTLAPNQGEEALVRGKPDTSTNSILRHSDLLSSLEPASPYQLPDTTPHIEQQLPLFIILSSSSSNMPADGHKP